MTRWARRLCSAHSRAVPGPGRVRGRANAPTIEFHQASFGNSETVGGITIDDAFVLGPAPGSALPAGGQAGVFLSIKTENNDQLTGVTTGAASSVQLVGGPVALTANSVANLSGPQPQIVLTGLTNALSAGQLVTLQLDFSGAGPISIQVPVEPAAYDYTSYSPPPSPTPSAPATPSTTASASPSAVAVRQPLRRLTRTCTRDPGRSRCAAGARGRPRSWRAAA